MSYNLLVWKWSSDLDTPSKRHKYRVSDVALGFAESGDHWIQCHGVLTRPAREAEKRC